MLPQLPVVTSASMVDGFRRASAPTRSQNALPPLPVFLQHTYSRVDANPGHASPLGVGRVSSDGPAVTSHGITTRSYDEIVDAAYDVLIDIGFGDIEGTRPSIVSAVDAVVAGDASRGEQRATTSAEDADVVVAEWLAKCTRETPHYDWLVVGEFDSYERAKDHLAPSSTRSSKMSSCTLCLGPGLHNMRVRYLDCTCREECPKRLRILWCPTAKRAQAYKRGQYGDCSPPEPERMTLQIRALADALFAEGITPSRTQHRLKAVVPAQDMPHVKKFQSRYRYFRISTLQEHSKPEVMRQMLAESCFSPTWPEKKFFSFGFDVVDGVPQLGFGGSTGTFKVGVTSKNLLRGMDRDASSFVFHWDATYKIDSMAYPVLICGLTDPGGNFHPAAFFLIGNESADEYEWAMRELMTVYHAVVGCPLQLHYVMADAAKAPIAAVKKLPQLGVKRLLMCFYHCVACVNKRLGAVSKTVKALVSKHLFAMHYSRSQGELQRNWGSAKAAWSACDALVGRDFQRYFEDEWMRGDCQNWQVYHTPPGFPTTNNPCELFNKHFKVDELSEYKAHPWEVLPSPSKRLLERVKRLAKNGLLQVVPPNEDIGYDPSDRRVRGIVPAAAISMAFAFEEPAGEDNELMAELHESGIVTMPASALALANAYYYNDGTNNIRHESLCCGHPQPSYGWHVSTVPGNLSCECNFFFKFKYCCHLLYALQQESKDVRGFPLPPKRFARGSAHRSQAAPRFTGRRRRTSGAGRNVRNRRMVGPPLSLQ